MYRPAHIIKFLFITLLFSGSKLYSESPDLAIEAPKVILGTLWGFIFLCDFYEKNQRENLFREQISRSKPLTHYQKAWEYIKKEGCFSDEQGEHIFVFPTEEREWLRKNRVSFVTRGKKFGAATEQGKIIIPEEMVYVFTDFERYNDEMRLEYLGVLGHELMHIMKAHASKQYLFDIFAYFAAIGFSFELFEKVQAKLPNINFLLQQGMKITLSIPCLIISITLQDFCRRLFIRANEYEADMMTGIDDTVREKLRSGMRSFLMHEWQNIKQVKRQMTKSVQRYNKFSISYFIKKLNHLKEKYWSEDHPALPRRIARIDAAKD